MSVDNLPSGSSAVQQKAPIRSHVMKENPAVPWMRVEDHLLQREGTYFGNSWH